MALINPLLGGNLAASDFDSTLIGNSVWFDSGDYFSQDSAASDSGRKEAIFSTWLQRSKFGEQGMFMCVNGSSANDYLVLDFQSDDTLRLLAYDVTVLVTTQVFRDVGWYHILVTIDTSQNSNASQKIFVNGEEVTSFSTRNNFGSSADIGWGRNQTHLVNSSPTSVGSNQMIGYLAQTALITDKSFQQGDYSITDFVDAFTIGTNGSQFVPKKNADIATIVGAGGNNSFLLTYQNSSDLGNDGSSKNNDFTANSMGSANQSSNTPSNVYAVMDVLKNDGANTTTVAFSEGNRRVTGSGGSDGGVFSTLPLSTSGTTEFQATFNNGDGVVGICCYDNLAAVASSSARNVMGGLGANYNAAYGYREDGNKRVMLSSGSTDSSQGAALTTNSVMTVRYNADDNEITWLKDNVVQGNAVTTVAGLTYYAFVSRVNDYDITLHFDSSDFPHTIQSGNKTINSANLTAPTHFGCDAFQSVTYSGNGSTRSITTDIAPAWVWIKNRSQDDEHKLVDIVRGVQKELSSDNTAAETTDSNGVTAFSSSSFSLGSGANGYNDSSENFIAWCWAAGTAFSNDASATGIGTLDSSGRVNASDSLSIVTYTGSGSNASIKHGLSAAPQMYWVRDRTDGNDWNVYSADANASPASGSLRLDSAAAFNPDGTIWNGVPSSTVINLGTSDETNKLNNNFIAYCFRSVPGVCKIGSYEGNDSSDGTYISLGFKCRWLLVKNVDTAGQDWRIYDSVIEPINPNDQFFKANDDAAQISSSGFDFLSDGVKARDNNAGFNSAATFVYVAMADVAGNGTLPPIYGR